MWWQLDLCLSLYWCLKKFRKFNTQFHLLVVNHPCQLNRTWSSLFCHTAVTDDGTWPQFRPLFIWKRKIEGRCSEQPLLRFWSCESRVCSVAVQDNCLASLQLKTDLLSRSYFADEKPCSCRTFVYLCGVRQQRARDALYFSIGMESQVSQCGFISTRKTNLKRESVICTIESTEREYSSQGSPGKKTSEMSHTLGDWVIKKNWNQMKTQFHTFLVEISQMWKHERHHVLFNHPRFARGLVVRSHVAEAVEQLQSSKVLCTLCKLKLYWERVATFWLTVEAKIGSAGNKHILVAYLFQHARSTEHVCEQRRRQATFCHGFHKADLHCNSQQYSFVRPLASSSWWRGRFVTDVPVRFDNVHKVSLRRWKYPASSRIFSACCKPSTFVIACLQSSSQARLPTMRINGVNTCKKALTFVKKKQRSAGQSCLHWNSNSAFKKRNMSSNVIIKSVATTETKFIPREQENPSRTRRERQQFFHWIYLSLACLLWN